MAYKLTYFNHRGRGELIRFIFAVADQKYDDNRIDKAQWPNVKHTLELPFSQIPVFEMGGQKYCQSYTIARYLARKFDLVGSGPEEAMLTDMVVDCVEDLRRTSVVFAFRTPDPQLKESLRLQFEAEVGPRGLRNLEDMLKANQGGQGYFVGSRLTWCDLALIDLLQWLSDVNVHVDLDTVPLLRTHREQVEAHPRVAAWIRDRPHSLC